MSKVNYAETFRPLTDLFTQMQLNTILLAYLPQKLESYLTGIITVDMFITSVIACGISTLFPALFQFITMTGLPWGNKKNVTMQIGYYSEGRFGYPCPNVFYEALSWLISQQTKKLKDGSFIIQPVNSIYENDDDDDCAPPNFNVLPEKNQQITIEYKEKKYHVTYIIPEHPKQENNNDNNDQISKQQQLKPSIYLTTAENPNETSVDTTTEFLNEIVRSYLETLKKMQVRSRYERSESYWHYVQTLSSARGLDSIALDESQENLLKKELETFVNDKNFYERIGMPYRRGILLYGKPGTGKTSLINAISSQLSRNIYYLNLKNIKNDNELFAAFSEVSANQIIVLEDVDTQSKVLHKRTKNSDPLISSSKSESDKSKDNKTDKTDKADKEDKENKSSDFSLSTFLGCLDGHTLAEGNLIIMTTNHVEHLDPACIRPGRMDVRLNLGYCTHYQIKKMFKSVIENPEAEFPQDILEKIPEKLLPPCEVMMTMILYRNEIDLIPQKIYELVANYKDIKSEEGASADLMDENKDKKEDVESEKEEIKDENKDMKEDVKSEKEEIKDENKDMKEDVKSEKEEIKNENKDKKEDGESEKEEIKDENKDKKEVVKNEKEDKDMKEDVKSEEEIKNENKDKKENVKDEEEEIKNENKDRKEDVKDGIKKKEDINEIQEKSVKDENKEDNKENKKEEEIMNEANMNNLNEIINTEEEDSDSTTDVELEIENDKIKSIETFTSTPQIA